MDSTPTVLDDMRSFMRSRIILSAVELNLFTLLDENPLSGAELADRADADPRALRRLLDCLVVFGLLNADNDRYHLAPAAACLAAHHPRTVLPMAHHLNYLWDNWSRLSAVVRAGRNHSAPPIVEKDDDNLDAFIQAMHVAGRTLAEEVAARVDLTGFQCLLDIGGATGTYTIAFLQRNPGLRAILFDLARVVPMADRRLREADLRERVTLRPGDFYTDELPAGADVALLSAIIHQNSPRQNEALFAKIHRALAPGGALLIRDHIMADDRRHPPAGAVFAINMLVGTTGGDTYTFHELENQLLACGFGEIEFRWKGEYMDGLIWCRKA
ncbi:MAG: methyltransferase domain-containing protein [Acidobacteria bacterium]|nr:methyltransferase domain-containing protein [Acidobacteriota bacterium]